MLKTKIFLQEHISFAIIMSSSDKIIIETRDFINNPKLNCQIEEKAEFEAERLGSGSFGAIYLVKYIKTQQKLVFLILPIYFNFWSTIFPTTHRRFWY